MTLVEMDLSHLTDEERYKVLEVLNRDEQLREAEQKRVRNLKDEVKTLRLKGTLRGGRSATRSCARCRESFGFIFNTGSVCTKCQHRVCKKCQETVAPGKWLCIFCFRQMEFEAKSGNWFYAKFPRSMRDRSTNEIVSGGKIVRDAISSGSLVDDLDPEMVLAYMASVSPQLPLASGKNSTEFQDLDSECVLETCHGSSVPTEFTLPRKVTVVGETAQSLASERWEEAATMGGAVTHRIVEDDGCYADLDTELFPDAIIPGVPVMRVWCENPVRIDRNESGVRTVFAALGLIGDVGRRGVEASDDVLPAGQSDVFRRSEDANGAEDMVLIGREKLIGFGGYSASTRDEDVEQSSRPVAWTKGEAAELLVLFDFNKSVESEYEEGRELGVSEKSAVIVKDSGAGTVEDSTKAPCYSEPMNDSCRHSLRSITTDSSEMHFNGSIETSMPLTAVGHFKDISLHSTIGSVSSRIPSLATDSEDVTNSAAFAPDREQSLDSECKHVFVSELTLTLESASHPVNKQSTIDNSTSDHHMSTPCLDEDIASCTFTDKNISQSCFRSKDTLSSEMASQDSSSSFPVFKDGLDDGVLVLHAAESKEGENNDISDPVLINSTNSSACVVLPDLADRGQKLPLMLLGVATDEDGKTPPVTSSPKSKATDRGCEPLVTLPAPSDVTDVSHSNGSCERVTAPTKAFSYSEHPVSEAPEHGELEASPSMCESIVFTDNCSNGSAGNKDSVRSKVGALLAKYGRGVVYENSPDHGSVSTEKNSPLLNGGEKCSEHVQVSISSPPYSAFNPSSTKTKDTDSDFHGFISESDVNLHNRLNNISNSNSTNPIYDENPSDIRDGYDLMGTFNNDRITNSVFEEITGRLASPSKRSWDQEENEMDSYGFSREKCGNFFLDDLEWDAGELDGPNDYRTGSEGGYEDPTFGLYSIATSESCSTDLTTLRDMLSTCLSQSPAGSPPHSPSESDNVVFFHQPSVVPGNTSRGFSSGQKFRKTLASRKFVDREVTVASNDDDDDNESLLSAISEHTEPEYLSD